MDPYKESSDELRMKGLNLLKGSDALRSQGGSGFNKTVGLFLGSGLVIVLSLISIVLNVLFVDSSWTELRDDPIASIFSSANQILLLVGQVVILILGLFIPWPFGIILSIAQVILLGLQVYMVGKGVYDKNKVVVPDTSASTSGGEVNPCAAGQKSCGLTYNGLPICRPIEEECPAAVSKEACGSNYFCGVDVNNQAVCVPDNGSEDINKAACANKNGDTKEGFTNFDGDLTRKLKKSNGLMMIPEETMSFLKTKQDIWNNFSNDRTIDRYESI